MTYRINGKIVTKEDWDADTARKIACGAVVPIQPGDRLCIGGFTPFESPVDGTIIASKEQLRDHEKKHNVRQVGNDYVSSTRRRQEAFEARKAESKAEEKDFLYTDINNPTQSIGEHYGKPSAS